MACPTLSSICEVCSDASYVTTTSGVCIKFRACSIEQCTHCYEGANKSFSASVARMDTGSTRLSTDATRAHQIALSAALQHNAYDVKNIRSPPLSGYCDYSTLCIDNTNCQFCQASDPFYCVSCNKWNMRPNSDGVCVVSNQTYCTLSNCVVCEAGNSNRCSVCGLNTYLSFFEGTCQQCPSECKTCTPVLCTSCIDTQNDRLWEHACILQSVPRRTVYTVLQIIQISASYAIKDIP